MAEQNDNATEKPTDKQISDAHKKGQFAQAMEIQMVAGLIAAYFVLLFTLGDQARYLTEFVASVLGNLEKYEIISQAVPHWTMIGFFMLFGLLFPMFFATTIASILAGAFQSRFKATPEVVGLNPDKLNPVSGFQRVFSKQGLVKMVIDLGKCLIVAALIYTGVHDVLTDPIFFTPVPIFRLGTFIYDSSLMLFFRLALAMSGLAILHYIYQLKKTEKDLMMTKQEIKDEHRQAQGDPNVKIAQRAMARRLLQRQMLADVPKADVIVTNPTHYAVALKYERGVDAAPIVLAKGHNSFAQRIKSIGAKFEVPTVENKPIARALFK
ncbi:MAG: flagellar biosynthesis protein FlhB, partial [Spartobacteria bacterium]